MGDLMAFKTWKLHKTIFYKITSSAFVFYVKGSGIADVGFSSDPAKNCTCWILLTYNRISIEIDGKSSCKAKLRTNLVTNTEFTKFWISWDNNKLSIGRNKDIRPLLSKKLDNQNLQYVTFAVNPKRDYNVHTLEWKLFMPPKLEKRVFKKVLDGDMQWVKADNQLPDGSLIGGFEEEFLYIIRAPHRGSLTPGKFVPSEGSGYISWGGEMHEKEEFEVLCGFNCIWVKTSSNKIPVGAIEAGYSEDGHEILYVGRAVHGDHLIPGKVQPSHSVCYIPYNFREVAKKQYEILVDPQVNRNLTNRCYRSTTNICNFDENVSDNEVTEDNNPFVWEPEDDAINSSESDVSNE